MIPQSAAVNEDVVKEDQHRFSYKPLEDRVRKCLKDDWGISEPEGHDEELTVALVSPKSCIGHIFLSHTDLMILGL